MESSSRPHHQILISLLTGLAVSIVLVGLLAAVLSRPDRHQLWGDEGTYVAMSASLVRDGDLIFGDPDNEWLTLRQPGPPVTVILQQTPKGITYSKPILYPLLSAPLYAIFDEPGMIITQALALLGALALAWVYLRRLSGSSKALWLLSTFVLGSVVLVYVGWKMSDSMLFSLTLVGLLLALGGRRIRHGEDWITMPFGSLPAAIVGGLLLGAGVSMRFPGASMVAASVLALIVDRRWRRGLVVAVMGVTAFLAISGVTSILLGTTNPYKAVRSSFNQETGYPAGDSTSQALKRFATRPATQSAGWPPPIDTRRTAYSSLYFIAGRHTGLLLYFPVAVILLAHLLRRPDRVSLALLLGLVVMVGFYLVWMPQNYFGGSTFVGNRYFLGAFPVLLVALSHLPSARSLGVAWVLAAIAWSSAAYSMRSVRDLDQSSQSHAFAGVFRLMPPESTAQRIDDLQERFWAEDYIRFLDPFAEPARWSFRLDSSRPAAELMVATAWPGDPLQFVVSPQTAPVEIEVSDWRETQHLSFPQESSAHPGLLQLSLSRPWRRHAFWWRPGKLYDVRVLRFALQPVNGDDTTAVVRYAGRGRELAPLSGEVSGLESLAPIGGVAGQETALNLKVHNTGRGPWKYQGTFPIQLGYRLLTRMSGVEVVRKLIPLPGNVPPDRVMEVPLTIHWPVDPGSYDLVLEILRQPTESLGVLGSSVLATREVQIVPPLSPDNPEP